jgi:hypothetical protein
MKWVAMAISLIPNSWSRIIRLKARLMGFTSTNSAVRPDGGGSTPSRIASVSGRRSIAILTVGREVTALPP